MKRLIRAVVALLVLSQPGCVVNGRWVELTPEQAALHVEPPRKGEQRFSLRKPAPEGVLVLFENITNPPKESDSFKVGFALVRRESFGWAVQTSATLGGNPRHEMLLSVASLDPQDNHDIFFGKIVDGHVARVVASFSSGEQIQDAVASGLFGMFVPKATMCRLELLDAKGQRIELFDWGDVHRVLAGFLGVPVSLAQQECNLSQENRPE